MIMLRRLPLRALRVLTTEERPRFKSMKVDKEFREFAAEARKQQQQQKQAAADDTDEMEDMFVDTAKGKEWGGPLRGGRFPEPTRFGDWERKGRATDF